MILWTIQNYEVWEELQKTGKFCPKLDYVEDIFIPSYKWLIEQMEMRLKNKPLNAETPLWAWYQWNNEKKKKPDLRYKRHLPYGSKGILLTCDIADDQVLLSDFHLWHYVLNYWYLPLNKDDAELFEKDLINQGLTPNMKPIPEKVYHKRIVESWERIFDLALEDNEGYSTEKSKKDKSIQATFWELDINQVKDIKIFVAK